MSRRRPLFRQILSRGSRPAPGSAAKAGPGSGTGSGTGSGPGSGTGPRPGDDALRALLDPVAGPDGAGSPTGAEAEDTGPPTLPQTTLIRLAGDTGGPGVSDLAGGAMTDLLSTAFTTGGEHDPDGFTDRFIPNAEDAAAREAAARSAALGHLLAAPATATPPSRTPAPTTALSSSAPLPRTAPAANPALATLLAVPPAAPGPGPTAPSSRLDTLFDAQSPPEAPDTPADRPLDVLLGAPAPPSPPASPADRPLDILFAASPSPASPADRAHDVHLAAPPPETPGAPASPADRRLDLLLGSAPPEPPPPVTPEAPPPPADRPLDSLLATPAPPVAPAATPVADTALPDRAEPPPALPAAPPAAPSPALAALLAAPRPRDPEGDGPSARPPATPAPDPAEDEAADTRTDDLAEDLVPDPPVTPRVTAPITPPVTPAPVTPAPVTPRDTRTGRRRPTPADPAPDDDRLGALFTTDAPAAPRATPRRSAAMDDLDRVLQVGDARPTTASTWRVRLVWAAILGLLVWIGLQPYPFEVGGDFVIQPLDRAEARARTDGEITELFVAEGDRVEKDQVLAVLSNWDEERDVILNRTDGDRLRAELETMLSGARPEEIAVAEEALRTAEVRIEIAARDLARQEALFATGTIPEKLVEEARDALDLARAARDQARANLALVNSAARQTEIDAQLAAIARNDEEIAFAELMLEYTNIRAPAAGQIVSDLTGVPVGAYLSTGTLFAEIEDTSRVIAEIELPEITVSEIAIGAPAELRVWSAPDDSIFGTVSAIAPRAEERDFGRIVRVQVEVPNPDGRLAANMTGFGKISAGELPVWQVFSRAIYRFFTIELWSWLP